MGSQALLDYELPPGLIAQNPADRRDQSRLLVARRDLGSLSHHQFADLPDLLQRGDTLVLNDTRVLPARLVGRRHRTGGKWEGLFVRGGRDGTWELLSRTRGRLAPGELIDIEGGGGGGGEGEETLQLRTLAKLPGGQWAMQPLAEQETLALLARFGQVPLPPYIRKGQAASDDAERYQTVYARNPGAVAAPTAGLHFTSTLFDRLKAGDVDWCYVTLHVGPGTFQPIKEADFTRHRMHSEWGEVSAETVARIEACKERGGRVVAVGTTAVRVLETAGRSGRLEPWRGETDLFVYPPFAFRVVDNLVTNFHLPRSTLLLLVSAFAGGELLRKAYAAAIEECYRFYSYGDAMLIL
jgi:S-adenosylmethionine:tRNA ribosyltransferase-isomerase